MKLRAIVSMLVATAMLSCAVLSPRTAGADGSHSKAVHHRQQTKNQWRNIAIGAGALGVLGLVKGNSTLSLAGVGGSLYAANRYEQDRKSQSKLTRDRAAYYSRKSYFQNGHKYVRKTVWKNGKPYFHFVRG